jgi:hypothetical protein
VYVRKSLRVDTGAQAGDFEHNLMTLRAEERLGLAIGRPSCFVTVTGLADAIMDADAVLPLTAPIAPPAEFRVAANIQINAHGRILRDGEAIIITDPATQARWLKLRWIVPS